ncbi:hypothetical protein AGOR_G00087650 [Albula goreensis]|uniref:Brain-enriched guanylate kinase-associated protein n=1 Tax=Albula goreensis TaxID=1534307 RepID=A0A8T3DPU0_9TELE|nr:hypothetical protein AGOR_G00087650 [Albula goreensis]
MICIGRTVTWLPSCSSAPSLTTLTLKLSELPADFQERLSLHMETRSLCHSPYSDSVPTTVIAKVLEKPDPESSLASPLGSPQPQDPDFPLGSPSGGESLTRRTVYRWSDLYCSDTALYCPDERPRERRQSVDLHGQQPPPAVLWAQNSTDSNADEDAVAVAVARASPSSHEHFAEFAEFTEFVTSLQASSSYSSFSAASDEKGSHHTPTSPPSHHQALYANWRDSDYERKSDSSYEPDSPGFAEQHVFQQQVAHGHQNGDSGPVYARTPSCFSEPYHSPRHTPQLYRDVQEEEPCVRWRRLSVEDISACSYRSPGRVSPYSFSEQHFAMRPAKIKLGPLYSSFQEGADVYCAGGILDPRFASHSRSATPSPERDPGGLLPQDGGGVQMYLAKEDSQESEHSLLFQSASSRDKESTPGSATKEYVDVSPNSSTESLNHNSLEVVDLQDYQSPTPMSKTPPPYQAIGSLGLTRKDSLTKAQLYGTLLN